jgi:hypothetical protein
MFFSAQFFNLPGVIAPMSAPERTEEGANFPVGEQAMTTHSIGHRIEGFNRLQTHRGIEHAAVS